MDQKIKRPDRLGTGEASKLIDFSKSNYTRKTPKIPARRYVECIGCKSPFLPARTWHRACRQCYVWHKALTGIAASRAALKEMMTESVDLIPMAVTLYKRICLAHGLPFKHIDRLTHHGCDGESILHTRDGSRIEVWPGPAVVYIDGQRYTLPEHEVLQ